MAYTTFLAQNCLLPQLMECIFFSEMVTYGFYVIICIYNISGPYISNFITLAQIEVEIEVILKICLNRELSPHLHFLKFVGVF